LQKQNARKPEERVTRDNFWKHLAKWGEPPREYGEIKWHLAQTRTANQQ